MKLYLFYDIIKNKVKNMSFNFDVLLGNKINSIIVVDLSSGLKFINSNIKDSKITAIAAVDLPVDGKETFIQKALTDFIKENNIQHKETILIPSSGSYMIKRLQLPDLPKQELLESIKWQIKDDLPFDAANSIVDYQIIDKSTKEDGSIKLDIMVVAGDYEKLVKQVGIIKDQGLTCLSVIPAPFSCSTAIEKYSTHDTNTNLAIFELQEANSFLSVYKNSRLNFYRELPVSVANFRVLLTATLVTEKGQLRLTEEEIKRVLFDDGMPLEGVPYKNSELGGQVISLLRPGLERLSQEIKRSLVYYESQFNGGKISKMYICGKAVKMPNLDKFLSTYFGIPVSVSALADKITLDIPAGSKDLSGSCCAVAAAIGYLDNVNILPNEFRSEKIEMLQRVSLRWLGGIGFIFLVVSFIFAAGTTSLFQKRLNNANTHLQVISEVKHLKNEVDSFTAFIKNIRDSDVEAGEIMKKLSNVSPADLFFETLDVDCGAKIGVINGYIVNIVNPDDVLAKLVNSMAGSVHFKDVSIVSLEQADMEGNKVSKFQLSFKLQ